MSEAGSQEGTGKQAAKQGRQPLHKAHRRIAPAFSSALMAEATQSTPPYTSAPEATSTVLLAASTTPSCCQKRLKRSRRALQKWRQSRAERSGMLLVWVRQAVTAGSSGGGTGWSLACTDGMQGKDRRLPAGQPVGQVPQRTHENGPLT